MILQGRTLSDALKGVDCNDLLVTTFTLDEVELYSLAQHLELAHKTAVIRFDPAGFRCWARSRIVSPAWLRPIRPGKSAPPGRLPPVFHPKIALTYPTSKGARLIVSTGNLAASDQQEMSNLLCVVQIGKAAADYIRKSWANSKEPKGRNLCVIVDDAGKASVEGDWSRPAWITFLRRIKEFQADRQDWLLASPFWSQSTATRLSAAGTARRIDGFFRDLESTKSYAPSLRTLGASGTLNAWVPKRGGGRNGMHHKVVAWRGTRGATTQVLLYIGSANLTEAGFLGVSPIGAKGKESSASFKAWNWEAGVMYVGDGSLWPMAKEAARAGLAWRPVKISKNQKKLKNEKGAEIDPAGQLRVHLRSAFSYTRTTLRRKQLPKIPGATLKKMQVCEGNRYLAKNLKIDKVVPLPKRPERLVVSGTYEIENSNSIQIVEIELAELSRELPTDFGASTVILTDALLSIGSPGNDNGNGKPPSNNGDGAVGLPLLFQDIRFPYDAFYDAYAKDNSASKRWLHKVEMSAGKGNVPKFWREVAKNLRARYL